MSRASVIAMLIAAEVLIVGVAIYAVGHGSKSFAAGMHHVQYSAAAIAPVDAGATPRVTIDDSDSRVNVGLSNDGLVHVRDLTEIRGAVYSSGPYPQLHVARTSDGVNIERAHAERFSIMLFGLNTQAIEVDVPAGARLEIARCAGARISGVTGGVSVHSVDGHIALSDLQGTVEARSDDGYISAAGVRGDRLTMESADGHLALSDVAVTSLVAKTRDGSIKADGLAVDRDATVQTNDGSVRMGFAPSANLTIDASTHDGKIAVDGDSSDHNDSAQRTIRLGAGTGRMTLATDDGSIHILTNGALQNNG
ncbi:MAG TPA: DUF4097 family beta strand repeat-containing protein [Candidatus Nitrosotalea sp.]|nr:DUF4097 family beta strand repeat-containing protein [Candidatus Nitrosotalea sp.]